MGRKGNGRLGLFRVMRGYGLRRLLQVARALSSGQRRSLADDAQLVVSLMNPQPRHEGLDLVPRREPFLLIGNHFEAPGLWVGWVTAAITSAIAEARAPGCQEMRWLVHPEWGCWEIGGRWIPHPVSALVFPRAIRVWGLMPTPARPSDVAGRARALRRILTHLRPHRQPGPSVSEPIGLFPEGTASFALRQAKPGVGAFLHRISKLGVPLLPVGVYLDDNVLVVRLGEPFFLGDVLQNPDADLDTCARRQIMVSIGRLLPDRLWGVHAAAIAEAVATLP